MPREYAELFIVDIKEQFKCVVCFLSNSKNILPSAKQVFNLNYYVNKLDENQKLLVDHESMVGAITNLNDSLEK